MLSALLLAGEIVLGIVGGLVAAGYITAGIRKLFNIKSKPFNVLLAEKRAAQECWIHRILVALDIFVNVCARGQEDETISCRSWRASTEGKFWGIMMIAWLNLFQPSHGFLAAAGDLERAEARVAVLNKVLGVSNGK